MCEAGTSTHLIVRTFVELLTQLSAQLGRTAARPGLNVLLGLAALEIGSLSKHSLEFQDNLKEEGSLNFE